jgi:hypothetical protein
MKKQDLEKVGQVAKLLEEDAYKYLKHISGGFAKTNVSIHPDITEIELTFGVQSDVDDSVHTESYKFYTIDLQDKTPLEIFLDLN